MKKTIDVNGMFAKLSPVSYTHLDVYKRQAKYNACYGAIDSVVNLMIRETGSVDGARFRPYLEPLSNGGYLVYCFYG